MRLIKNSPPVIHLKRRKGKLTGGMLEAVVSQKKHGPEPFHKGSREEGPPAVRREVDPNGIPSAWVSALGSRLKIDKQKGFFLDKLPVSLDTVMIETNRIRKAHGLAPVGRNPKWVP